MITRQDKLAGFLPEVRSAPWVALDTEADSLHAYPEKVCLIQVSLPGKDVIVDPLGIKDLSGLWEALAGREIILHGADYDLRLLRRAYGFVPASIFDTMLAARLLGHRSFGLSHLVGQILGVTLEKGPQKANWARRPLSLRMEDYARNDSRHLKPLEAVLRRQLVECGRLEWHREMCQRLVQQCAVEEPPDPDAVWRVRGSRVLDRRGLAVLRALWHWREKEALAARLPPFFILSPESLVGLAAATAAGQSPERWVPKRFSPRRQSELAGVMAEAMALPLECLPLPAPRLPAPRLSAAARRQLREITLRRDASALDLKIDPTLIASRSTLLALACDGESAKAALQNWQRRLLFEQH